MKTIVKYIFVFFLPIFAAQAEIVVITNIDNPVLAMTKTEIQSIFMGRKRSFASGLKAVAFDFSKERAILFVVNASLYSAD